MTKNQTPSKPESAEQPTDEGLSSSALLAIFDVLVTCAGARESMWEDFLHSLRCGTREYRFQGNLGFGGKYWPETNTVSCYTEDMTDHRRAIITDTNGHLAHCAARLANQ